MKYIQNKIGDVLCKDSKGKEKWIALPSVEKGDPDNPRFISTNYLKGYAPIKSVEGLEELASEIEAELNEVIIANDVVELEETTVELKPSNLNDRSTNYNTTNAVKKMKGMDAVDLEMFTIGDDRKTVINSLSELKNK